jgi:hypothetical protein
MECVAGLYIFLKMCSFTITHYAWVINQCTKISTRRKKPRTRYSNQYSYLKFVSTNYCYDFLLPLKLQDI